MRSNRGSGENCAFFSNSLSDIQLVSCPIQSLFWGALGKGVDSHKADISVVLIYLQKQLDDFYVQVQVWTQS